jgi:hypothetical protein
LAEEAVQETLSITSMAMGKKTNKQVNQSLFNFNQSQSIKILGMESANKDALKWIRTCTEIGTWKENTHLKCNKK